MVQRNDKLKKLEKFKYPLLVLLIGTALMLIPGQSGPKAETGDGGSQLQQILSNAEGVGEASVLLSENGVVVVCRGAESAKVRLDIIRAVSAYTGFGADKITILKMAEPAKNHVLGGDVP